MDHLTSDFCFDFDYIDRYQFNQPKPPNESSRFSDFESWASSYSGSLDCGTLESYGSNAQGVGPSFGGQYPQQLIRSGGYPDGTMDQSWFQLNAQTPDFETTWSGSYVEPAEPVEPITRMQGYHAEPFLASHLWTTTSHWPGTVGQSEVDRRLYNSHYHNIHMQQQMLQVREAERAEPNALIGYNGCQSTVRAEANNENASAMGSAVYPWMTIVGPNSVRREGVVAGRRTYSGWQRLELEKEFRFDRFLTIERRSLLSRRLLLTDRQVKLWFQNRRMKVKKETERIRELNEKQRSNDNGGRREKQRQRKKKDGNCD